MEGTRKLIVGAVAVVLGTVAFYVAPLRITGNDYFDLLIWISGAVIAGNVGEWFSKRGVKPSP